MKFNQAGNNLVLEEVMAKLSEKLGREIILQSVEALGGGCIHHASKITTSFGNYFLKWNAEAEPDIFVCEAQCLVELKKAVGGYLAVPEVFASKQVDSTPGFLVLEYLHPGFSTSGSDEKLGRGLAKLHQKTNSQFGFYRDNYCGATIQNNKWDTNWPRFFSENRLQFLLKLIQSERPFSVSELKHFEKLILKIPELIPAESIPVLIHGDLWSGNFMYTEKGPALIDPASYYADREMEFAIITLFGGFSDRFFAAYNEVNPLPSRWKERNRLYQLYHVLNHYYLFGGGYGQQAVRIAKSYL